MGKRTLICWIGHNDLRAMAGSLPAKQREEILAEVGGIRAAGELGPIKTLVHQEHFDSIHLLSNYKSALAKQFAKWIGTGATAIQVGLKNPTDYAAIYRIASEQLAKLKAKRLLDNVELCIHLSPGSPAMAAVWLLLGTSRYRATFYQTFKGEAWVTEVPFDLAFEFISDTLRESDAHIQHLLAQSPGEVAGFEQIAGDSRELRLAVGRAKRAAMRNVPVLLLGESGTGKEMFAQAVHESSARSDKPFRAINCAALSAELIESELFGHKKGSFTGAVSDRKGLFEEADGGTLFLDEIGECDQSMQAKLLRVLQPPVGEHPCHRIFYRVGESEPRSSNVRILAATNCDLFAAMNNGEFREDLFYRLAGITIKLPALRTIRGDIPIIVSRLMERINQHLGSEGPIYRNKKISDPAMAFVKRHPWPGNVRQLYNALLQAAVMSKGETIGKQDVVDAVAELPTSGGKDQELSEQPLVDGFDLQEHLNGIQKRYLQKAMEETRGNKTQAARLLGLTNYQTLDAQLKRLNVEGEWK